MENINKLELNYQLSWASCGSQIAPFYHINTHQQQTFGYTPVSIKRKCRIENSTWVFQMQSHIPLLPPQIPFSPPNQYQLRIVYFSFFIFLTTFQVMFVKHFCLPLMWLKWSNKSVALHWRAGAYGDVPQMFPKCAAKF